MQRVFCTPETHIQYILERSTSKSLYAADDCLFCKNQSSSTNELRLLEKVNFHNSVEETNLLMFRSENTPE